MTTQTVDEHDKALWAAAKSLHRADRIRHNANGGAWPTWERETPETRLRYRMLASSAVTPPEAAPAQPPQDEPRLLVESKVRIPLGDVQDVIAALARTPINGLVGITQVGHPLEPVSSGSPSRTYLTVTWDEVR